jgi:hypothetical protein
VAVVLIAGRSVAQHTLISVALAVAFAVFAKPAERRTSRGTRRAFTFLEHRPLLGGGGGLTTNTTAAFVDPQGVGVMSSDRLDALGRQLAGVTSRRSALTFLGFGAAAPAVTALGLHDALAKRGKKHRKHKKKKKQGGAGIGPVDTLTGIPVHAHSRGRNFNGILDITEFVERDGGIVALGALTGKVTGKGVGNQAVNEPVELPVNLPDVPITDTSARQRAQAQQLECEVLHLELGPITLNLLGLNVFIGGPNNTPLIVDITADPSGGLLGQLLCALAGGGPLAQIVDLLNQILAILQGL